MAVTQRAYEHSYTYNKHLTMLEGTKTITVWETFTWQKIDGRVCIKEKGNEMIAGKVLHSAWVVCASMFRAWTVKKRTSESHNEHWKHELGWQSSLKIACIIRVPLTPWSGATSYKRRHDVWVATRAAGAADPWCWLRTWSLSEECCFLQYQVHFQDSARTQVYTKACLQHSTLLNYWCLEDIFHSKWGKTLRLMVSLVLDRSLLRKLSFRMRIRVTTVESNKNSKLGIEFWHTQNVPSNLMLKTLRHWRRGGVDLTAVK